MVGPIVKTTSDKTTSDKTTPTTLLDTLMAALRRAGDYNSSDLVRPAAVLWTDEDAQWQPLLPALRAALPILTLGDYDPETRTGPAYWIRCVLTQTLPEFVWPETVLSDEAVPIIYLPGVSKQEIRAVESCPRLLQPLAELQYRGVLWTQRNGRDWTVAAFLQSKDGMQIPVAGDNATKEALLRALPVLATTPRARLQQDAPLHAAYLDALLNPDEVRRLLQWLNDPQGYPKTVDGAIWTAFCNLCVSKYNFHPETDGPLAAAQQLAQTSGPWPTVWQRYTEAPAAYPNLPQLLRQAKPAAQLALFEGRTEYWPQDNEAAEADLRQVLLGLANALPNQARQTLSQLETEHGPRRNWIWAAPLAAALTHLTRLAQQTAQPLAGDTLKEVARQYTTWGWQVDGAVMAALESVRRNEDVQAVAAALHPLYQPWLQEAVQAFQKVVHSDTGAYKSPAPTEARPQPGTCYLFVDALRFDVGQRLVADLETHHLHCTPTWQMAALPTVTPTAKPAVAPVAAALDGSGRTDLTPAIAQTGSPVTATSLRRLLADAGYQILLGNELGDPTGLAWSEAGALDRYGHEHGWKLAQRIPEELHLLRERITALLEHGWQRVVLLTDHGWLFLPGNLPKQELPIHVAHLRKGRCAVLKTGTHAHIQTVPWHWDADIQIAQAHGIACFEEGKVYEHGGLSPQECIVPVITVTAGAQPTAPLTIEEVTWRGLRCTVVFNAYTPGITVDIRAQAANDASSVAVQPKALETDGTASLLIKDEDHLGETVQLVAVADDGTIQAQTAIVIGE